MSSSAYDPISSTTTPARQLRGRQASRLRIIAVLAIAIAATLGFALTALAAPAEQDSAASAAAQIAPMVSGKTARMP